MKVVEAKYIQVKKPRRKKDIVKYSKVHFSNPNETFKRKNVIVPHEIATKVDENVPGRYAVNKNIVYGFEDGEESIFAKRMAPRQRRTWILTGIGSSIAAFPVGIFIVPVGTALFTVGTLHIIMGLFTTRKRTWKKAKEKGFRGNCDNSGGKAAQG